MTAKEASAATPPDDAYRGHTEGEIQTGGGSESMAALPEAASHSAVDGVPMPAEICTAL